MATYATSAKVAAIYAAYEGYVDAIDHDDDTTKAVLKAEADEQLGLYADAQDALRNPNASSASSYSGGVGSSFQKKTPAEIRQAADTAFARFVQICALGGVTVPTIDDSVSYWDMSRSEYR